MSDDEIRAALGDGPDVLARLDSEGRVVAIFGGLGYLGQPLAALVGKRFEDILLPHVALEVRRGFARCLDERAPTVVNYVRELPHGERRIRVRFTPSANGALALASDVTERLEAKAALDESQERYRLLTQATTDAIFDWDVQNDSVWWNERISSGFGYPQQKTTLAWWSELIHPDDRPALLASVQRHLADRRSDVWVADYRFRAADGRYRHVSDRCFIQRDSEGNATRVIGSKLDVTERKELDQRMATAERVMAVGVLAAGMAHEIHQPLNHVVVNTALAMEALVASPPDVADARTSLQHVQEGAEHLRSVVSALTAMAQPGDAPFTPVDLSSVIELSLRMLDPALAARGVVDTQLAKVPPVLGDAHRLGQVVMNLVVNALQAAPAAASHRVTISLQQQDRWVVLDVGDNGRGVPPEDVARLFDPFFTTKPPGEGTGLGLSIARAIVTRHHGEIEVLHVEPHGATFRVRLPALAADVAEAVAPVSAPSARSTILVVDDDELSRALVRRILEREHDVVLVADADAALAALQERHFDLVLSDVVMPGVDGRRLYRAVSEAHGGVRFAFMTAGPASAPKTVPCLDKPFTPTSLRAFVRDVMSA